MSPGGGEKERGGVWSLGKFRNRARPSGRGEMEPLREKKKRLTESAGRRKRKVLV